MYHLPDPSINSSSKASCLIATDSRDKEMGKIPSDIGWSAKV